MDRDAYEATLPKDQAARDAFWQSIGETHRDVLAPMLPTQFFGGPQWPNGEPRHIFVRTATGTIVASDGLSNAFDEDDEALSDPAREFNNGYGFEVYVKTSLLVDPSDPQWPGYFAVAFGEVAADFGGRLWGAIDQLGLVSSEINGSWVPPEFAETFVNSGGGVGVLMGGEDAEVPLSVSLSFEPAKLIRGVVLTRAELNYAFHGGDDARREVLAKLDEAHGGVSVLDRPSVV